MMAGVAATWEVQSMRVNRGLLGWGLFLVLLGTVPLAVRAGTVDIATVRQAWELWPLILIGIGVGLVLGRTRAAFVGGLIVAVTFGLIGGSLLAAGWSAPFASCGIGGGNGSGAAFATRSGSLGSDAVVDLTLSCGDLAVTTAAGSTWTVAGSDEKGVGPQIEASLDRLLVETARRSGVAIFGAGDKWQVTLPQDPRLALEISVNAGSARLDLAGANVPKAAATVNAGDLRLDLSNAALVAQLEATVNAGSLKVRLPAQTVTGSLTANAGSIEVCVPSGVAIRLHTSDNPLGGNNFGSRGLLRSGSDWVSSGFDSAATRIELSTTANVGSINLNPENGCE
jgi:hypothetical protein